MLKLQNVLVCIIFMFVICHHHITGLMNAADSALQQQQQLQPGVLKSCSSPLYTDLLNELDKDATEDWLYKDLFKTPQDIGISKDLLNNAMPNFGNEERLKQILVKALSGESVELAVIGGSISRGAPFSERGQGFRVYFNEVVHWWSKTFQPVTGSTLTAESISLGGIGTDYYSYCLSTHMSENDRAKIFLWELSANDRGRYDNKQFPKAQPLEQLTRNILNRRSKPALLYLNFFRGNDFIQGRCMNFEDEGGLKIAKHYKITSISWRDFVCERMKTKQLLNDLFSFDKLFSSDRLHPSILGHAQMAYMIINYLKTSFARMLRQHACQTRSLEVFAQETFSKGDMVLSPIIYHETSTEKPLCYTYFKNDGIEPNNTLINLRIMRQDDFRYNLYKKFKIRGDQLGGLQTNISEQLLQYEVVLPRACRRLVLVTHSLTGSAQVWVDKNTPVLINTLEYHMGTKIEIITTNLKEGQHFLNIFSLQGGFAVSGIAVV